MADPHAREGRGADLQVLASLNQVCVCLHQITAGRVARRRRGIEYIGEPEKRSRSRTKASWGVMEGERGNNYTRKAEGTITLAWKPTRLGVEVETRQESNRVTRNGRRGNKAGLTKPNPKAAWGDRPNKPCGRKRSWACFFAWAVSRRSLRSRESFAANISSAFSLVGPSGMDSYSPVSVFTLPTGALSSFLPVLISIFMFVSVVQSSNAISPGSSLVYIHT